MEEILKQILGKLDTFDKRFDEVDNRFNAMEDKFEKRFDTVETKFEEIDKRFENVDSKIETMDNKFDSFDTSLNNLATELDITINDQSEMRKEMAFYFSKLMKEQENTRVELKSDVRHLEDVLDEHQGALDVIAEKSKVKQ